LFIIIIVIIIIFIIASELHRLKESIPGLPLKGRRRGKEGRRKGGKQWEVHPHQEVLDRPLFTNEGMGWNTNPI